MKGNALLNLGQVSKGMKALQKTVEVDQNNDNKVKKIESLGLLLKPKSELIGYYIEYLWNHNLP